MAFSVPSMSGAMESFTIISSSGVSVGVGVSVGETVGVGDGIGVAVTVGVGVGVGVFGSALVPEQPERTRRIISILVISKKYTRFICSPCYQLFASPGLMLSFKIVHNHDLHE
jgi:hypothetical protein